MKNLSILLISLTIFFYSCSSNDDDTTTLTTEYTLIVKVGEGGTVSTEGGTYDEGTEITITATPEEGYEFVGWEGSDSAEASITITLNSETTLQAVFLKLYLLEIDITEGGYVVDIGDQFVEGSVLTIEAIPADGFDFIEWSDGSTDNPRELILTSNTQLTPLFQRKIDFISKHSGMIFIGEVDQYGNQYENYFTRDTIFGRTSFVDFVTGDKLCWDQANTDTSIYKNPLYEVYEDSIVWSGGFIITDGYRDTLGTRNGSLKILNSSVYKIRVENKFYSGEISIDETVFTISNNHVCDELSF